jgi:hypothetical protein
MRINRFTPCTQSSIGREALAELRVSFYGVTIFRVSLCPSFIPSGFLFPPPTIALINIGDQIGTAAPMMTPSKAGSCWRRLFMSLYQSHSIERTLQVDDGIKTTQSPEITRDRVGSSGYRQAHRRA